MDKFTDILEAVKKLSNEQKQLLFLEIREFILIHDLEKKFNVRAEIILEAINRASDLTQRGIRGVIAETIFGMDVIPAIKDWKSEILVGDLSYDACLSNDAKEVRIQVKMQRKERGEPKKTREGLYVVEVQRTRTGEREGISTRPYRFNEFDLLAVCMEPSTKSWKSFMYAATSALLPDARDSAIIKTFQPVPHYPGENDQVWTADLSAALQRAARVKS